MTITDIKKIIKKDIKVGIDGGFASEEGEYLDNYIYEQGFKHALKNVLIYLNKIK